jgi:hypothetical protein
MKIQIQLPNWQTCPDVGVGMENYGLDNESGYELTILGHEDGFRLG